MEVRNSRNTKELEVKVLLHRNATRQAARAFVVEVIVNCLLWVISDSC